MCSDVARPTSFQVFPASVDLYTPSPYIELRGFEFSPVPSQTTFESFGSMTTQQRLKEPPESKIGVQVTPRFSDFQRPPTDVAA